MNRQLNTVELETFMLNDAYIRNHFGGVRALDQLDSYPKNKTIYIVNQDTSDKEGSHWIVIFMDSVPEHFDSSGQAPIERIHSYLIANGPLFYANRERVQDFYSNSCGLFCLFFAYFKSRGYTFADIMSMFSSNLVINENIVQTFYESVQ